MPEAEIKPMDVGDKGMRPDVEAPTVTALVPDTAVAGSTKDLIMTVEGTGFHPRTVITFNGFDEPTTFIDAMHVSTGVKPSLFKVPVTCDVSVRNDGFAEAPPLQFTFTDPNAPPVEGGVTSRSSRSHKAEDDDDDAHGKKKR